jgi:8-oxo-dGTP pyrophosphatase MutT (NUDIX family)
MKKFASLINDLCERLKKPLPGLEAQMAMASRKRIKFPSENTDPLKAIPSGVLILLYPFDNDIYFVLIRRPDYSGIHARQIGLPGGKFEEGDGSLVETAIREAREEIGIDPSKINVIGKLTALYIPPSNFIVTPVLAWASERPVFTGNPREVDGIIEVSLSSFLRDTSVQVKRFNLVMGLSANFPCYFIDKNIIWGATAMILSEFRTILKEII